MPGRKQSGLTRDKRGVVAVEYVMILIMFVLPSIAAISAAGRVMLQQYKTAKMLILLPIP